MRGCSSLTAPTALVCVAGYKGSSDLYIDSNAQLALAAAKQVRLQLNGKQGKRAIGCSMAICWLAAGP